MRRGESHSTSYWSIQIGLDDGARRAGKFASFMRIGGTRFSVKMQVRLGRRSVLLAGLVRTYSVIGVSVGAVLLERTGREESVHAIPRAIESIRSPASGRALRA